MSCAFINDLFPCLLFILFAWHSPRVGVFLAKCSFQKGFKIVQNLLIVIKTSDLFQQGHSFNELHYHKTHGLSSLDFTFVIQKQLLQIWMRVECIRFLSVSPLQLLSSRLIASAKSSILTGFVMTGSHYCNIWILFMWGWKSRHENTQMMMMLCYWKLYHEIQVPFPRTFLVITQCQRPWLGLLPFLFAESRTADCV